MDDDKLYNHRIDSRIMEICNNAERDYIQAKASQQSHRIINHNKNDYMYIETNNRKETDSLISNYSNNYPHKRIINSNPIISNTQKSDTIQCPYNKIELAPTQVDTQSQYSSKFNEDQYNHQISFKLPITIHKSNNNTQRLLLTNTNNNNVKSSSKLFLNQPIIFTQEHIQNINKSIKMKSSSHNNNPMNLSKSISLSFNSSLGSSSKNTQIQHHYHNILSKHTCISCSLQKKINNSNIYHSDLNKKIIQNININKLLLDAKRNISIKNYQSAYDQLIIPINQGLYHADLFYLYGEVCRLLKRMEEAEDYFLLSLNFEHHSPYVFYSLGMLYQEVNQLKYSNSFLKKFNNVNQTSDVHYELGKNYYAMKKYLKSADQLTKAINLKSNKEEYYNLRAEVYKKIGLEDLANEDHSKMEGCK